jgi:predicted  nucleic acid-binding Zn-ribbon protein
MAELHEISVAIGELRAEVKANRDAMVRVENRLGEIATKLTDKHEELDRELGKVKLTNAKHATIISAVVAGVVLFGKQILIMIGAMPLPK